MVVGIGSDDESISLVITRTINIIAVVFLGFAFDALDQSVTFSGRKEYFGDNAERKQGRMGREIIASTNINKIANILQAVAHRFVNNRHGVELHDVKHHEIVFLDALEGRIRRRIAVFYEFAINEGIGAVLEQLGKGRDLLVEREKVEFTTDEKDIGSGDEKHVADSVGLLADVVEVISNHVPVSPRKCDRHGARKVAFEAGVVFGRHFIQTKAPDALFVLPRRSFELLKVNSNIVQTKFINIPKSKRCEFISFVSLQNQRAKKKKKEKKLMNCACHAIGRLGEGTGCLGRCFKNGKRAGTIEKGAARAWIVPRTVFSRIQMLSHSNMLQNSCGRHRVPLWFSKIFSKQQHCCKHPRTIDCLLFAVFPILAPM